MKISKDATDKDRALVECMALALAFDNIKERLDIIEGLDEGVALSHTKHFIEILEARVKRLEAKD